MKITPTKKSLTVFAALTLTTIFATGCGTASNVNINTTDSNRQSMGNSGNGLMNTNSTTNSNSINNAGGNSMMNSNMSNMNRGAIGNNDFMLKAAQGGIAEVELGRLASTKAQSADVKKFAQTMVQDHTNANTELKSIATKKNMMPPTDTDAEHKTVMTRLQNLSGAEFDRAYMDAMVADHEKTIALFEAGSEIGTDADIKTFAAKTLPKLRTHLEMAQQIQGKIK